MARRLIDNTVEEGSVSSPKAGRSSTMTDGPHSSTSLIPPSIIEQPMPGEGATLYNRYRIKKGIDTANAVTQKIVESHLQEQAQIEEALLLTKKSDILIDINANRINFFDNYIKNNPTGVGLRVTGYKSLEDSYNKAINDPSNALIKNDLIKHKFHDLTTYDQFYATKEREIGTHYALAQTEQNLATINNQIILDPDNEQVYVQQNIEAIKNAERLLEPSKQLEYEAEKLGELDKARFHGILNKDPNLALQRIKRGDFSHLSPSNTSTFLAAAEHAVEQLKRKRELEAKAQELLMYRQEVQKQMSALLGAITGEQSDVEVSNLTEDGQQQVQRLRRDSTQLTLNQCEKLLASCGKMLSGAGLYYETPETENHTYESLIAAAPTNKPLSLASKLTLVKMLKPSSAIKAFESEIDAKSRSNDPKKVIEASEIYVAALQDPDTINSVNDIPDSTKYLLQSIYDERTKLVDGVEPIGINQRIKELREDLTKKAPELLKERVSAARDVLEDNKVLSVVSDSFDENLFDYGIGWDNGPYIDFGFQRAGPYRNLQQDQLAVIARHSMQHAALAGVEKHKIAEIAKRDLKNLSAESDLNPGKPTMVYAPEKVWTSSEVNYVKNSIFKSVEVIALADPNMYRLPRHLIHPPTKGESKESYRKRFLEEDLRTRPSAKIEVNIDGKWQERRVYITANPHDRTHRSYVASIFLDEDNSLTKMDLTLPGATSNVIVIRNNGSNQ
jgi:hypothetical protein